MNPRAVLRVLGFICVALGAALAGPIAVTAYQGGSELAGLGLAAVIPLAVGLIALLSTRGREVDLTVKDGFAIVTFGWLTAAVVGTIPYLLTGSTRSVVDAFFESMSGFTTTGSTIFTNIEALPPGILLWRSLTQWLGGGGIILLTVAVLPILGIGGMQLYKAEVPGPTKDRLTPRIQSTAKSLWLIYFMMTLVEIALLIYGGMTVFEACNHAFTTVSTGGFSTRNGSIGAFQSPFIEGVIIAFMFLAGVNFSLHMWMLRRRAPRYLVNEEFRLYLAVNLIATCLIAFSLILRIGLTVPEAFRQAAFQTVSILTTTGYGTADYALWGFGAQVLLFLMMFLGGSAGSTSGGMKLMRIIVLTKHAVIMARKEIHPRAIYKLRYSGVVVPDDIMLRILGFFLLYMVVFFTFALLVAFMGVDTETALGASIAALSNIGPGLNQVGPATTFAGLPVGAKLLLTVAMLLGRLEFYTVLVITMPMFWRRT